MVERHVRNHLSNANASPRLAYPTRSSNDVGRSRIFGNDSAMSNCYLLLTYFSQYARSAVQYEYKENKMTDQGVDSEKPKLTLTNSHNDGPGSEVRTPPTPPLYTTN